MQEQPMSADLQKVMKEVVRLSRLPVVRGAASIEEESAPEDFSDEESAPTSVGTETETGDGGLTLELQGKIKMTLRYDVNENPVDIVIDDTCLRIIRDDGTEASIPIRSHSKALRAA